MSPFFLLFIAIISEVFGSTMLKISNGFKRLFPSIGVIIGMATAFYLLSLTLTQIPLSTAYAIWSGAGTALTSVVGILLFKERIHFKKVLGLILIIGGVITLRFASSA
ncbi:QacE family quaternary ammonium compound efflux SMR transporter [Virgibacillus dokdonensis]|uniref:QacE family quaternary ammonium compound efflux SMR transporter n=1 Tax=Virgibacillus dokdonensis TaxID=302167 RepID=A0A3E0WU49_9BACI|nr:multidrug efflux SMR transporter [Virgibacillus dokdonensis]RFA35506.1 QacE family quaternary ammonium compound efflux SMR transporter [Virgibacillus dokdonensis]